MIATTSFPHVRDAVRRCAMTATLVTLLAASLDAAPVVAEAEPQTSLDSERPADRREVETDNRSWYAWQTIVLDAIWLSSLAVSAAVDVPELTWASLGVGLLGVPTVHLAHGNLEAAGISVGLRAAAGLLIGSGLFLLLRDASDDAVDDGSADGALGWTLAGVGAAGMLVGAFAVDAGMLAYRPIDDEAARITPWFAPRQGVAGLRLSVRL